MRQLTFTGFLKRYVQELAAKPTLSLRRLANTAAVNQPRLREPLYLYAIATNQTDRLLRLATGTQLARAYDSIQQLGSTTDFMHLVQNDDPCVPDRFRRVWRSYQSVRNRHQSEAHTKGLMHEHIRRLQREKGITAYRVCRDLNLNPGNLNAFLKQGNASKLSLATTRRVLRHLERAETATK